MCTSRISIFPLSGTGFDISCVEVSARIGDGNQSNQIDSLGPEGELSRHSKPCPVCSCRAEGEHDGSDLLRAGCHCLVRGTAPGDPRSSGLDSRIPEWPHPLGERYSFPLSPVVTEPCADVNEKQCARGACSGLYPGFTQHVSLLILLPLGRQQRRGLWILSALGQPGLTDSGGRNRGR